MKSSHPVVSVALVTLLLCIVPCASDATNPIQKVLTLLGTMEQQLISDGKQMHHGYLEFSKMCEDRSRDLSLEIKTANSEVEDYKATIDKATDDEGELTTEIEELSSVLSTSEADLKAATKIRQQETGDFAVDQKDLIDTISQMERAISILEKQQAGGASFAQLPISVQKGAKEVQDQRAAALAEAFAAIVDSSTLESADTSRLASLIQASEGDSDSASATDGDAAELDAEEEAYSQGGPENKGSIVETLQNLLEKAQAQLETARFKEIKSKHNYELFQASLQRKITVASKDMIDAKKAVGEAGQTRAQAEGNFEVTKKDLAEDTKDLNELHHECMSKATDFEEETKNRNEELKALATAKKVIKEMTGAAEEKTYGDLAQVSFLQSRASESQMPPSVKAVRVVRELGKSQKMPVLLDMAHKMESIIRNSAISGEDPFRKVKSMLSSMLGNLVKQMEAEASHKAYCDKEMTDTKKSKSVKESMVDKLSTRVDTQSSETMNLKSQVAVLQKELLAIMKTTTEMNHIRKEEHALYEHTKPELEMGQEGIKKALQVLRAYYSQSDETSQDATKGGGSSIIGVLEVVESDFAKGIANLDEQEQSADAEYKEQTNANKEAAAVKQLDVTLKTKAMKSISKDTSESSTDLDSVQTELDAVNEYYAKIQQECVAKPEPYEERRKRHEATLHGLQDAMQILEGSALVQESVGRLRGVAPHNQPTEMLPTPVPADGLGELP